MRHLFWIIILAFSLSALACGSTEKNEKKEGDEVSEPISGYFKGEVRPANSYVCFAGAYYRKVVSSKDWWVGIEGEVILPHIVFDTDRTNPARPAQYLDNPSIYMGGNADGQETDLGLAWEVIRDENGVVTSDRVAFRPFMRRAPHLDSGQQALYVNAPAEAQYYWYPGDKVRMSLSLVDDGVIRFIIEGEGKKYSTDFSCNGYRFRVPAEYKRVSAIDQFGNEGKNVSPTKTKVLGSAWNYTNLIRLVDKVPFHVPMHRGRFTDMRCPSPDFFNVLASDEEGQLGAEIITIDGALGEL